MLYKDCFFTGKQLKLFFLYIVVMLTTGCNSNSDYTFLEQSGSRVSNTFFFGQGILYYEFEGTFVLANSEMVFQSINLNIDLLKNFDSFDLYALYLDYPETDPMDPLSIVHFDRLHLGFFGITNDTIYRLRFPAYDGVGTREEFVARQNSNIVKQFEKYNDLLFENWTIVSNDGGTEDILIDDEWHSFVEVDGDKRVYHFFSRYEGGTRFYERIVWERDRGIVHYFGGFGSMREHVEFYRTIPLQ